ncbi:spore gernimation protein GerC [Paenibacillus filicis]|uniref:Spore gernimation protein GerC n=1 Tax=Paenibacillus gyeongsangnamensis TaxID=3388067 RepID=A0ABT4QLM2_9BACL|nr:Ger(x)C family spore germination C-terminal domain-containing protein [Paenibacillus filicis]MCZ8517771.1 spore gernimation protein GerC [Paenibacillus filicis]
MLDFVVTLLKKAIQGQGEPITETTELKGPSLVEAVGQGAYVDKGPFLAINTRNYLMSERFASHDPIPKLAFLLRAPYTSINTPVVVFDGSVSKLLKNISGSKKTFTEKLNDFILSLDRNGIMPTVSMMHFILSREEPLEDIALPLVKQSDSGIEFGGALLFRQGKNTEAKLGKEQVRMLMLLLGNEKGGQKFIGKLLGSNVGKQPLTGHSNGIKYGFSVKKNSSKIIVHPESSGLPKVYIGVRLKINVFDIGQEVHTLKPDYVNRMEKELSKHLEVVSVATIKTLQKANCDVLGIGKELKAYHPNIWKSMDWRKDYPRLSIKPHFDVQILNSDAE